MDSLVALEWQAMGHTDTLMVWWAYDEGKKVGYRELGAHWAVESRGDSTAIRIENNGDRCIGAGQNNARLAATRVYGEKFTLFQLLITEWRLTQDRQFAFEQSMAHVRVCLAVTQYRWSAWKCYNNIEAKSKVYPGLVQAWLKFLDDKRMKEK